MKHVDTNGPMHPTLGQCHLWTGGTNGDDYGVFRVGSQRDGSRRQVLAHRFAFAIAEGRNPVGTIDHRCRVSMCVRRSHLEDTTQRVNVLRGTSPAAIHAAKTKCPHCGGPYSVNNRGQRFCRLRSTENNRRYRANR